MTLDDEILAAIRSGMAVNKARLLDMFAGRGRDVVATSIARLVYAGHIKTRGRRLDVV